MSRRSSVTTTLALATLLAMTAAQPALPHGEEAGFGVPGDPSQPAHIGVWAWSRQPTGTCASRLPT